MRAGGRPKCALRLPNSGRCGMNLGSRHVVPAMIPNTYARDPIVEAAVELQFLPGRAWSGDVAQALAAAFRAEYPAKQQPRLQINVEIGTQGEVATQRLHQHRLFFPSEDGKALVGVGENFLSVHVLAPYPGWDRFRPRVARALETFRPIARPGPLALVGIRYIDQIGIPNEPEQGITSYFPCMSARPESMPNMLDGFHNVMQASDAEQNYRAVLRLASLPTPTPDGRLQVLYDLNLVRPLNPAASTSTEAVLEHFDFLHARQRKIFEDSISERTRSLFQ